MAYCQDLSLYEYPDDADEPGRSEEGTSLLNDERLPGHAFLRLLPRLSGCTEERVADHGYQPPREFFDAVLATWEGK